ncbi:MAG: hypothetical protein HQM10_27115 [Candidatus Riflebacteria bacterium]|nr:hypothetical protein [Candidatus Riflebacteria bacterium]
MKKIIQTDDGHFVFLGETRSNDGDVKGNNGKNDAWVGKIDENGNLVDQICLGGLEDDYLSCLVKTRNGGYILSGGTFSKDGPFSRNHGKNDFWIVRLSE